MPLDILVHPCDAYISTSTVLLTRPTAHSAVYNREELPKLLVNGSGTRGYGVVRDVRIKIEEEDLWCRHNWINHDWMTYGDGICG